MLAVCRALRVPASAVIHILAALFWITSQPGPLLAGTEPRFQVRLWSESSGLPHNTVNALIQTDDRYVWIGTNAGLVRWDGYTMTVFSIWNTPVLKSDKVLSLFQDRAGTLWIGTAGGGLYSFRNGSFTHHRQAPYLAAAHVRSLVADGDGSLWAGTEFGLYRLAESGIRRYSVDDGLPDNIVTSLCLDGAGRVWAGTLRGGAAVVNTDLVQRLGRDEGLGNTSVLSLASDASGSVWIGTMQGLYSVDITGARATLHPGVSYTPVSALLAAENGALWVGTMADGLQLYSDGVFDAPAVVPDNHITCLCRAGDMFFAGTGEQGLAGIRRGDVVTLPAFGSRRATALIADDDETLWAGSEEDGLFRLRRGAVTGRYTAESGLPGNRVRALLRDSLGRLWAGDENGGAAWIDGTGSREISALAGIGIRGFRQNTASDTVWIAAADGLYFYDGGTWGSVASLAGKEIRALAGTGRELFAATESALYRLAGKEFRQLTVPSEEPAFTVQALYGDSDGFLWIGTGGSGLKRWRDGTFATFSTLDGLPDNVIYSIVPGSGRTLWLGSRNGLFSLQRDSLEAVAAGRTSGLHPVWITGGDGLPHDLCSGCSPSAVVRDSLLYIATREGIGEINTAAILRGAAAPPCRIVTVMADGRPLVPDSVMTLPPGTRHLLVELTGFDWGRAEKLRFRYFLQGVDSVCSYINPGEQRIVQYRDLPAGEYRFTAAAVSDRAVIGRPCAVTVLLPPGTSGSSAAVIGVIFIAAGAALWVLLAGKKRGPKSQPAEKYRTTPVDPERVSFTTERLKIYMEEDRLFLDPDLSLKTLAKSLKIHPNHLSRIINEQFGVSFNDYINRFRIREAMSKLSDPAHRERSILDIMYECGFYSKSVFNTAFRKFAGTTPSAFRKKHA
ncbi:helix-turn-helix domain-containing protein [bacterium]|nr:helix-turn-helix domain-containing protein [bacterium]